MHSSTARPLAAGRPPVIVELEASNLDAAAHLDRRRVLIRVLCELVAYGE